jgi:hypothetical protein
MKMNDSAQNIIGITKLIRSTTWWNEQLKSLLSQAVNRTDRLIDQPIREI